MEGGITVEENERAKALEAILLIDSVEDARQSQQEIMEQIKKLHREKPIKTELDGSLP